MTREIGRIKGPSRYDRFDTEYWFIEREGKEDLFVHSEQVYCLHGALEEGTWVTFVETTRRGKACANRLYLLANEQDNATLLHCFEHGNAELRELVAKRALAPLSESKQVQRIQTLLLKLPAREHPTLIRYLDNATLLSSVGQELRFQLSLRDRFRLYAKLDDLVRLQDEIKEALAEESAQGKHRAEWSRPFWKSLLPRLLDSEWYYFAPPNIQREAWEVRLAGLLAALRGCFAAEYRRYIQVEWNALHFYRITLTAGDHTLAQRWCADSNDERQMAQMLSARAAEHAARRFYQNLDHQVEDVAIQQTQGSGWDWRTHDLLLDGQVPVDVKNARLSRSCSTFYGKHTVPRFKETRQGQEVRIAGVLSPYLQYHYLCKPKDARFQVDDIVFLGETSRAQIKQLERLFNSTTFEFRSESDQVIASWLFDYPDRHYHKLDKHRQALHQMQPLPSLSLEVWELLNFNPIPAMLAAGLPLQEPLRFRVQPWMADLYDRLCVSYPERITLPQIFLTLLTHFLEMIALPNPPASYSPEEYPTLLYSAESGSASSPLGLRDTQDRIDGLCQSLSTLWAYRNVTQLDTFRTFQFYGRGLLQGREHARASWKTILAYCGGYIEGAKCGNSPLVLGNPDHKSCSNCHKLICDLCGFCSENCSQCRGRHDSQVTVAGQSREYSLGEPPPNDYLEWNNGIPWWADQ